VEAVCQRQRHFVTVEQGEKRSLRSLQKRDWKVITKIKPPSRLGLGCSAASFALAIALASSPAFAQDAPGANAPAAAAEPEENVIIVTGSRIQSPNLKAVSPITTLTSQDIKLTGRTNVEDMLNSLPSVLAGQNNNLANGATGTATVDLRGLGPSRTLVLINGRRLMTGDPNTTSSAADLNFIPSSLVKRVDVLTGGASATYGADAVAGVVNFIMDKDFTGFRVDSNYGFNQHGNSSSITPPLLNARQSAGFQGFGYPTGSVADGGTYDTTVSFGGNFADDKGHATAYFGYQQTRPVQQDRRDYSACTIQVNDAKAGGFTHNAPLQCGGSLTNRTGTGIFYTGDTASSTLGLLGKGTFTQGAVDRYNFAPANHFQRPDRRYTAGVFADYEVSEKFHPYMEFMFMNDRTVAQVAPSGDFGNTLTINCDNPLMSAQQRGLICNSNNLIVGNLGAFPLAPGLYESINGGGPGSAPAPIKYIDPVTGATYNKAFFQLLRRNVEGGNRIDDLEHTQFRTVLGARGDIAKGISYDAYFQYGRTNYSQVFSGEFSARRLTNALDVVAGPNGVPECRVTETGQDPNCVPYDVFNGNVTPGALNYLSATGFLKGYTSQQIISGTVTIAGAEYGVKTPWATDGVGLALGVEHRKDSLNLDADNEFQTGDLTGQGAPTKPVSGSYTVTEGFGELNVPIVQDSFIYNLTLNGGYRYSHYKISNGRVFNTNTWKINVDFAPIKDVRFRGGINRAVRVPNLQELFAPQIVALDGVTDPCSGKTITAADTGCLAQGFKVGQKTTPNPSAQYNGLIGGNPDLTPERSTTKTFGVVIEPRMVRNLTLSVDYFDIKVKNAIQKFGADAIQNACVNDNNLSACALVHRNPAGSLWLTPDGFTTDIEHNIGGATTKGFDFNVAYSHDVWKGRLTASLVGTETSHFKVDNGLTTTYDCAGYYGPTCGNPLPKWRHRARLNYSMENGFGVTLTWRYLGPVDVEYRNPSTTLAGNFYDQDAHINSQSYFDLAVTATFMDKFTWRLGVNNLLDKDPPLVTSGSANFGASACSAVFCNGNTYPGTYDVLGRFIYTGVTLNF
jgi:outer membrane receptor protein involved in Fe transport